MRRREYRALWNEVQQEAGYLLTRLLYLMQSRPTVPLRWPPPDGKLAMNKLWKQRRGDFRLLPARDRGRQPGRSPSACWVDESASMGGQQKHRIAPRRSQAVLLGETLSRIDVSRSRSSATAPRPAF